MSSKNSSVCAINGCKNKNQQKHVCFFRFPKARDVAQEWVNACNTHKLTDLFESQESDYLFKQRYMICSDHFDWKCFKDKNLMSKGLLKTAIPTKNIPSKEKTMKSNAEDLVEMKEIKIEIEVPICHGCLSTNRRLTAIGDLNEILNILVGTLYQEHVCFCWECIAVLRKLKKFQIQLKYAQDTILQMSDNTQTLSKLTIYQNNDYDQEIYFNEITNLQDFDSDDQKESINIKEEDVKTDIDVDLYDSIDIDKQEIVGFDDDDTDFEDSLEDKCNDIKSNENTQTKTSPNKDDEINSNQTESNKKISKKASTKYTKEEYNSYAIRSRREDFKKPLSQYFTKVYLDEEDLEISFLKKDRTRQGDKMNFKCDVCSLSYARQIDLDRHSNLNHHTPNTPPYSCLHCKKMLPSLDTLKEHWRWHSLYYNCNICFKNVFGCFLALHISRSHINVYGCPNCKLTFSSQALFKKHYNKNHPFVCDYCNKKCALRSVLEKHMRNHHIPQQCVPCNKDFDSNRLYRAHCREMHPDLLNITDEPEMCYCVECDRQFPSRALYMKHISSKHILRARTPKKLPCPDCGRKFKKNSDLMLHYDFFHLKVTKFHCDLCDKYFQKMYSLRIHMENVHQKLPKTKNKICDLCGRAFQSNAILNNHRRTHTGERPFKCEVCPAAFAQKGAMIIHQRKQHNI